ncbi:MAG: RNA recognition motif domain-containing protein [Gammaproteobacteria bacterium]
MKKMFVGNLPTDATEDSVRELFSEYGTVRSIRLATDVFTGKCRGFGFVEMEGHEAKAAIAGLNGKNMGEKSLRVGFENPRKGRSGRRR